MQVGVLAYGLDRPLSGISRTVLELGRALRGIGCPPVFLTPYRRGPFVEDGSDYYYLPGCRLLPGLMTWGNFAVPLAAKRLGLELVHDPVGISPFFLGRWAGSFKRVVTLYDAIAFRYPEGYTWLNNFLHRRYIPATLANVDAVITVSQHSKEELVGFLGLPENKVFVAPNGVDKRFHPAGTLAVTTAAEQYGILMPYILYVGALEARKNLVTLLRAFALVRKGMPDISLVLAGRPTWKYGAIFDTLKELRLEESVRIVGYVEDADLPALYSGAGVFVFPSLYEGFGMPVLEAMACGAPVVCSNTSSLPEVAGDCALLVNPSDPEALASALERVLGDPELAEELRSRGLERAKLFTWEQTARITLQVYQKVLGII